MNIIYCADIQVNVAFTCVRMVDVNIERDYVGVFFRRGMQTLNHAGKMILFLGIKFRICPFEYLLDTCNVVTFKEVRSN